MRTRNFEMNYSDGAIRYISSVDFEGETLSNGLIRNAICPAGHTMDYYLNGLMAVNSAGKAPAEAVAEVAGAGG